MWKTAMVWRSWENVFGVFRIVREYFFVVDNSSTSLIEYTSINTVNFSYSDGWCRIEFTYYPHGNILWHS